MNAAAPRSGPAPRPLRPGTPILAVLAALLLLVSCAENPVTGERELALVGEATELQIGREQYGPTRQMQGGTYDTDPQLAAYVSEVGQRVARYADRDLPYEFAVINSSVPNAWALPGGKIAVNRGLLVALENEAELAAVLGHEVVHAAARHGAQSMERGMLAQGAVLATAIGTRGSEYARWALQGAQLGAQLIQQRYGREAEREADRYGMQYMARAGYDPRAAITLQEKFLALSEGRNPSWLEGLFASHPPSRERIENNRETAATLPPGGALGRDRYQRMTAEARAAQPAYDAHDEGRAALADGDTETALRLAERALEQYPKEALFHALRGDVRLAQDRPAEAVTNYDRAIARDDDFFYHHLRRGQALLAQGREAEARQDLQRSHALLPTPTSANLLGQLALRSGDRAAALDYLSLAASAESPDGLAARRSLVRLTLEEAPGRHLALERRQAPDGGLYVVVTNTAPLAVAAPTVRMEIGTAEGMRRVERTFPGVLPPGRSARLDSGVRAAPGTPVRFDAAVVGARLAE